MKFTLLVVAFVSVCNGDPAPGCPAKSNPVNTYDFTKIGTYRGYDNLCNPYDKTYYLSNWREVWANARTKCEENGMEFVSLETLDEANNFLRLLKESNAVYDDWIALGAITTTPRSVDRYTWVTSGEKVTYHLRFGPGQPDFYQDKELCLSAGSQLWGGGDFYYNDYDCYVNSKTFVCQIHNIECNCS